MGGGSGDTSLGAREVECCQQAPAVPPGIVPHVYPLRQRQEHICLQEGRPGEGLEKVSSPEEGVMLYADLPKTLGRAMVGQLEANGALKLFILGEDRNMPLQADPALEDMMGWDLPCQGAQVPLAGAITMQKKVFFNAVLERSMPSPTGWWDHTPTLLA